MLQQLEKLLGFIRAAPDFVLNVIFQIKTINVVNLKHINVSVLCEKIDFSFTY